MAPPALWITLSADKDAFAQRAQTQRDGLRAKFVALAGKSPLTPADQERLKSLKSDLEMPARAWNAAVDVYGRLKPGVSRARAETEIDTIASALSLERGATQKLIVRFRPANEGIDYLTPTAAVLMGIVGLAVLIACANVTNLLLAGAADAPTRPTRSATPRQWRSFPRASRGHTGAARTRWVRPSSACSDPTTAHPSIARACCGVPELHA